LYQKWFEGFDRDFYDQPHPVCVDNHTDSHHCTQPTNDTLLCQILVFPREKHPDYVWSPVAHDHNNLESQPAEHKSKAASHHIQRCDFGHTLFKPMLFEQPSYVNKNRRQLNEHDDARKHSGFVTEPLTSNQRKDS
jgi:hypothetical protein